MSWLGKLRRDFKRHFFLWRFFTMRTNLRVTITDGDNVLLSRELFAVKMGDAIRVTDEAAVVILIEVV